MSRLVATVAALLLATTALAATVSGRRAAFSLTAAGVHADSYLAHDETRACCVQYVNTAGTFTARLNQSLDGSTYTAVVGSGTSASGTVECIDNPVGLYQLEATACSSCALKATMQCTGQRF